MTLNFDYVHVFRLRDSELCNTFTQTKKNSQPIKNMKLDATDLRYLTSDEFRVLTAVYSLSSRLTSIETHLGTEQVEMGSKNHEVVPTGLIAQISGLRNGGANKLIGVLAKRNLVSKVQNTKCKWCSSLFPKVLTRGITDDGYRLTYGGYDYLAMRALLKRDSMYSVGNQIGVGKESGEYSNDLISFCCSLVTRHLRCC